MVGVRKAQDIVNQIGLTSMMFTLEVPIRTFGSTIYKGRDGRMNHAIVAHFTSKHRELCYGVLTLGTTLCQPASTPAYAPP